jgi:hypothetical protein
MKTENPSGVISRGAFLRRLALGAPLLPVAGAMAQVDRPDTPVDKKPDLGNLRAFIELARSDLRTQKALLIAENLPFTHDEAVEFWPLHREYEQELSSLLDARYAGIKEFFHTHGVLTDDQASDLAKRAFELEEKRTALKWKYFKKFRKVIPAVKAARFFQIENQINMAVDLQVAASLPFIK